MVIEISNSKGQIKQVRIAKFTALEGWEIQRKFVDFASSTDNDYKKKFTMDILRYSAVVIEDRELPMITDALIDNHLETWQNVQVVFEQILLANGIDPATHATKPDYWTEAGEKMAAAFIAKTSEVLLPILNFAYQEREYERGNQE